MGAGMTRPFPTERAAQAHVARALIAEARRRRGIPHQRGFCALLMQWAANARRAAMAARAPQQMEMRL